MSDDLRARRFQHWLDTGEDDLPANEQLDLFTLEQPTPPAAPRTTTGDPHSLEPISSVLHRWLEDLYAKQQAAA